MEEADKPRRPCTKRFRLVLWWLTYRLPVLDGVNKGTEELARKHCKYSKQDWARDRTDFQSQWERMLSKREWRFRWFIKHGKVPNGWTLPDPKDPHSRKYPKRALASRLPKKYRMLWPVLLDRSDCELMEEIGLITPPPGIALTWPICAPASDSAFLARSISWIDLRSCRSSLGPKLLEKRGFKALGQAMPSRYILDDAQLSAWPSG